MFINFKMQGEEIAKELKRSHKITSVLIHGDQSQMDRMKAFEKMRLMKIKVIIASDLLSRGVDLPDVKRVINFDVPLTQAEFFHRIGRSGRFGTKGQALSLICPQELNYLPYLRQLLASMEEISADSL